MRSSSSHIARPRLVSGRHAAPAIALLALALLAGCGGASSTKTTTAGAASIPEHETHEDVVAAVAACRHGIETGTWLSASDKKPLYEVCDYGLRAA